MIAFGVLAHAAIILRFVGFSKNHFSRSSSFDQSTLPVKE
jgi:hypothetical protein